MKNEMGKIYCVERCKMSGTGKSLNMRCPGWKPKSFSEGKTRSVTGLKIGGLGLFGHLTRGCSTRSPAALRRIGHVGAAGSASDSSSPLNATGEVGRRIIIK